MDFDSARGGVIVSDENQGVLLVDPATGDRRLVSSATSPGPQIYFHRGIGFDQVRDRYLVTDGLSLFAVSPVTGNRTMLSDWSTDPSFGRFFRGMSVASESGAVFLGGDVRWCPAHRSLIGSTAGTDILRPASTVELSSDRSGSASAVPQRCRLRRSARPALCHRWRVRRSIDRSRRERRSHIDSQCKSGDGCQLQRPVRHQVRREPAQPARSRLRR